MDLQPQKKTGTYLYIIQEDKRKMAGLGSRSWQSPGATVVAIISGPKYWVDQKEGANTTTEHAVRSFDVL
jgi:hypothetical protein